MNPANKALPEPSTFALIRLLFVALLYWGVGKIPAAVRQACLTVCGLIAMVTPLLLWIASKTVFCWVLTIGCTSIAIIYLLVMFSPEEYL